MKIEGSVRVLGVDPGTAHVGLAVVEISPNGQCYWIGARTIRPEEISPALFSNYRTTMDVTFVAVEVPEGRNGPAIKFLAPTARIAGECFGIARTLGFKAEYLLPREWRKPVTGKHNPSDKQIHDALDDVMDLPTRSNAHERDAAGIAVVVGIQTVMGFKYERPEKADVDTK